MDVHASLRYLRIAPRKVRLVIDLIRGKSVKEAELQLQFLQKGSARPIMKLLQSAKANAKNNFELNPDEMYIKSIIANEGPALRRYMPKAFGKADVIRKKSSHIHIVLAEKGASADVKKVDMKKEKTPASTDVKHVTASKEKKEKSGVKKTTAQTKKKSVASKKPKK